VGRLVVAELDPVVLDPQRRVGARHAVMTDADVVEGPAADRHLATVDVILAPELGAVDDHEACLLLGALAGTLVGLVDDCNDRLVPHRPRQSSRVVPSAPANYQSRATRGA